MSDNQFLDLQKQEQEQVRGANIDFMVGELKRIGGMISELKRDIRTVREDLRNLDKLRPLRISEE